MKSLKINGFNFGLNFGGGIDFEIIRHLNVEIAARYSLGLLNMLTTAGQQDVADNANAGASLHLNDIQFMSGVSYSL